MVYKNIFDIRGSAEQIQIYISAIDKIFFPWHVLRPPKGVFLLGFADLNSRMLSGRMHAGVDHPGSDKDVDVLEGEMGGRKYVMGVFYPSTGNIYLDQNLIFHPELAQQTVSAELAHSVDAFYMTDRMREEINLLVHGGIDIPHSHSKWWEIADYNSEYFSLVAESWMAGFTFAYTDMAFDMSSFTHKFTKEQAPQIRAILGLQRTDYIPPAPLKIYKVIGTSKIYHTLEHYPKRPGYRMNEIVINTGLYTPCKFCKP